MSQQILNLSLMISPGNFKPSYSYKLYSNENGVQNAVVTSLRGPLMSSADQIPYYELLVSLT